MASREEIVIVPIFDGRYFGLQKRDDDAFVGGGMVGAFGGKLENSETAAEAARRELSEEAPSLLPGGHLISLGEVSGKALREANISATRAYVFWLLVDRAVRSATHATEGLLVWHTLPEIYSMPPDKLMPATGAYFGSLREGIN